MNRLRDVLNDNAAEPRYIETIPRRGYRFVAHVARDQITSQPEGPVKEERPHRFGKHTRRLVGVLSFSLLGLAAMIFLLIKAPNKQGPSRSPGILIQDASSPALSRDGKLLAYVSAVGGDVPHIWVRQIAGGKAIQVTKGVSRDTRPDFSPDGTQILFSSELNGGGVYLASNFSGDPKLILPRGYWASFSPDGQTILSLREGGRLIALDRNGDNPAPVGRATRDFQVVMPPLWSPSGQQVLFFGRHNGESYRSDRWWLTPLVGIGAAKSINIPGLEPTTMNRPQVHVWNKDKNGGTFLLYSIQAEDTWRLFRAPLTEWAEPLGSPEPFTSGVGQVGEILSSADQSKIIYAASATSEQLFEIPIGSAGQKTGPTAQLPLTEGASYSSPSVSRDGRLMTYSKVAPGIRSLLLKDFTTGTDRMIEDEAQAAGYPVASISPNGSRIVFNRRCYCDVDVQDCAGLLVSIAGGDPEQICWNCTPRGFSSDGSLILLQRYEMNRPADKDKILAVDLRTRQERVFLEDAAHPLYHAYFSWDDRWVVFKRLLGTTEAQILIAPVRAGRAAESAEWIPVTDGRTGDDKPQMSPDGNTVYFTSDRDGYLCIWSQRLNPVTKHPTGAPTAFEHFHNSMGRDAAMEPSRTDLIVARDKVVINLPRRQEDIWSLPSN